MAIFLVLAYEQMPYGCYNIVITYQMIQRLSRTDFTRESSAPQGKNRLGGSIPPLAIHIENQRHTTRRAGKLPKDITEDITRACQGALHSIRPGKPLAASARCWLLSARERRSLSLLTPLKRNPAASSNEASNSLPGGEPHPASSRLITRRWKNSSAC
jgi:hypothetical protein